MEFEYLTNIPLEKAKADYIEKLIANGMQPTFETIRVEESVGRITAGPVYAHICAPHYNASAMDGIALDASLTYGASETTPVFLRENQYTVVDTGDPLPKDCNTVVMVEDVIKEKDGVKLYHAAVPWQHIRQIGEDIAAGDMILPSYTSITPSAIGALIASGILEVSVIRKPIVGIIPTGDEIVSPTTNPKEGEILEFNSSIFSSMIRQWGAEAITYPIVIDNLSQIKAALADAVTECDAVILNAGSSAGREDYSTRAINEIGEVLYHGIAIKPGKPAILGLKGKKPVLGVPGYPVSGIIVIEELLRPIIELLTKHNAVQDKWENAVLTKSVLSSLKYEEFVRVRLGYVAERLIATPLNRGSGVVSSFMKADGILRVPQGLEGYESGTAVKVRLLHSAKELQNSLVAIGSHDPLLDEISDIMKKTWGNISINSSHVGSMGGIMAIRRREAHTAGIHLLDESTGVYNTAYIKNYFPNGGVRLIECVKRTQGLMLAKGNPKKISVIHDLIQPGVRYVNRQKGSGTRILCDFICRKENIDTDKIYGYDREEFTHTAVAALIAADSADAGLGVYSAAKLYDLDFMPICEEQYDLLIPDYAWDTRAVKCLIEVLQSSEFRQRLMKMGGYSLENPGNVRERL